MRVKFFQILAVLSGSLVAGLAIAAPTPAEEMTETNAQIALLEAKSKRDDLIIKRNKQAADIARSATGAVGEYQVVWVEGLGKERYAQLIAESGSKLEVKVGDRLGAGLRVVEISTREVVVEDGAKRRKNLAFAPASRYDAGLSGYGSPMYPGSPTYQGSPMPAALPR